MNKIKNILQESTVNSMFNKYSSTVNSTNTVNSKQSISEKIEQLLKDESIQPEGVAQMLAEGLEDVKSRKYYILLAKEHNNAQLLRAMHLTKEASIEGKIRTTKPIYFQAILRNWKFKIKFKEA